jgi:hypothetical protein
MNKFDPTRAVTFDVAKGTVKTGDDGRVVLVPGSTLRDALEALGDTGARALGLGVGRAAGQHTMATIGSIQKVREAALDTVVTQLAGELSIRGIGLMSMERWGRIMVLSIENPVASSPEFLAGVIEGAFVTSTGRELRTTCIDKGSPTRILLSNQALATKARGLIQEGQDFAAVIARLQEGN